jgi:hypothetical protein
MHNGGAGMRFCIIFLFGLTISLIAKAGSTGNCPLLEGTYICPEERIEIKRTVRNNNTFYAFTRTSLINSRIPNFELFVDNQNSHNLLLYGRFNFRVKTDCVNNQLITYWNTSGQGMQNYIDIYWLEDDGLHVWRMNDFDSSNQPNNTYSCHRVGSSNNGQNSLPAAQPAQPIQSE